MKIGGIASCQEAKRKVENRKQCLLHKNELNKKKINSVKNGIYQCVPTVICTK